MDDPFTDVMDDVNEDLDYGGPLMARLYDDINNPRLRDLVGSIVSDPVTGSMQEPFVARDIEDDAWVAAYAAYPMHINPDASVPSCCLDPNGKCEVRRATFFAGYMDAALGPVMGMAAQHTLDLVVDPVHTLVDDHVRLAKPNRTRSHR